MLVQWYPNPKSERLIAKVINLIYSFNYGHVSFIHTFSLIVLVSFNCISYFNNTYINIKIKVPNLPFTEEEKKIIRDSC